MRKRFPLFATVVVASIVPIFVVNALNPFCVIFVFFRVSVANIVSPLKRRIVFPGLVPEIDLICLWRQVLSVQGLLIKPTLRSTCGIKDFMIRNLICGIFEQSVLRRSRDWIL